MENITPEDGSVINSDSLFCQGCNLKVDSKRSHLIGDARIGICQTNYGTRGDLPILNTADSAIW